MATTGRDYYEILGVDRSVERGRDQEGVPAARARSCTRTSPRRRTRRSASARSSKPTRCSRSPRRGGLYDRFGHAGLQERRLPARRRSIREPRRHLLGVLRRGRLRRRRRPAARARSRHRGRGRDRARGGRGGIKRAVPIQVATRCERCRGDGVEPGTQLDLRGLPRLGAYRARLADRVRRVHPQPDVPALQRRGPDRRAPLRGVRRRGARAR